jgi:hypothetical protein
MFWGGVLRHVRDSDESSASVRVQTTYCRLKRPVGHAGGVRLGSPATGRSLVRSPRLDRGTQRKSGSNRAAPRAPRLCPTPDSACGHMANEPVAPVGSSTCLRSAACECGACGRARRRWAMDPSAPVAVTAPPGKEWCRALRRSRREGKLLDITLLAGGIEIAAHQDVLVHLSPYFEDLLRSAQPTTIGGANLLVIGDGDTDGGAVATVVDCFYSGELSLSRDTVGSVIHAAELLRVDVVENAAREYADSIGLSSDSSPVKKTVGLNSWAMRLAAMAADMESTPDAGSEPDSGPESKPGSEPKSEPAAAPKRVSARVQPAAANARVPLPDAGQGRNVKRIRRPHSGSRCPSADDEALAASFPGAKPGTLFGSLRWSELVTLLAGKGPLVDQVVPLRPHRLEFDRPRQMFLERPRKRRLPDLTSDKWLNSGGLAGSLLCWINKDLAVRKRYARVVAKDDRFAIGAAEFCFVRRTPGNKEGDESRLVDDRDCVLFVVDSPVSACVALGYKPKAGSAEPSSEEPAQKKQKGRYRNRCRVSGSAAAAAAAAARAERYGEPAETAVAPVVSGAPAAIAESAARTQQHAVRTVPALASDSDGDSERSGSDSNSSSSDDSSSAGSSHRSSVSHSSAGIKMEDDDAEWRTPPPESGEPHAEPGGKTAQKPERPITDREAAKHGFEVSARPSVLGRMPSTFEGYEQAEICESNPVGIVMRLRPVMCL